MDQYFKFINEACQPNYPGYVRDHLSRAHTMKRAYEEMLKTIEPIIIELGTIRSFLGGQFKDCMNPDPALWQPDNPSVWDWGAGSFSRVFAEIPGSIIHTVDIVSIHIGVCKKICDGFDNVFYHVMDSGKFLERFRGKADLIYMDTGDMTPLEDSARLHERDANIIVNKEVVEIGGYVLIDDVRNAHPLSYGERTRFGKAKYSIGIFLANGYDIVMDEYQLLLKRMA